MHTKITFLDVKKNEEIRTYIKQADLSLEALGFTEHSFAHATKCAEIAGKLLNDLGDVLNVFLSVIRRTNKRTTFHKFKSFL